MCVVPEAAVVSPSALTRILIASAQPGMDPAGAAEALRAGLQGFCSPTTQMWGSPSPKITSIMARRTTDCPRYHPDPPNDPDWPLVLPWECLDDPTVPPEWGGRGGLVNGGLEVSVYNGGNVTHSQDLNREELDKLLHTNDTRTAEAKVVDITHPCPSSTLLLCFLIRTTVKALSFTKSTLCNLTVSDWCASHSQSPRKPITSKKRLNGFLSPFTRTHKRATQSHYPENVLSKEHVASWFSNNSSHSSQYTVENTCEMICYLWFSCQINLSPVNMSPLQPFILFNPKTARLHRAKRRTIPDPSPDVPISVQSNFTAPIGVAATCTATDAGQRLSGRKSVVTQSDLSFIEILWTTTPTQIQEAPGIDFNLYVNKETYVRWVGLLEGLVITKEKVSGSGGTCTEVPSNPRPGALGRYSQWSHCHWSATVAARGSPCQQNHHLSGLTAFRWSTQRASDASCRTSKVMPLTQNGICSLPYMAVDSGSVAGTNSREWQQGCGSGEGGKERRQWRRREGTGIYQMPEAREQ
ncbi:hypothetical protein BGY98DRAFT_1155777 [Russula aff. rugulosa BPL654]|nr:hypothetical protein BGY98DRAFT_1155777 [Russula aff. rugulosa BPL654]